MKKINIPRVIWVSSLFLILIILLVLVMVYKINYEYLSYNYLYFYECDGGLCVSNVSDNKKLIYSMYGCGYDICPEYVKKIEDDYVILTKDNEYILYNYRTSNVISEDYDNYEFITNDYIIVSNNKKKGIIDINNNVITDTIYDDIGYRTDEYLSGYNLNEIIVKKDNLYGIISYKSGSIVENTKYSEEELNTLIEMINS